MQQVTATIAVYGKPNMLGDILSHEAALLLFDQLRQQETMPVDAAAWHILDTRIVGSETEGEIMVDLVKFD